MVYGADLNARTNDGQLPIDMGHRNNDEIEQAIHDEPRRRMDEAPGKRCSVASASAQRDDEEEEEEQSNKRPRLDEGAEKVAEEDEDSDPSSNEEGEDD